MRDERRLLKDPRVIGAGRMIFALSSRIGSNILSFLMLLTVNHIIQSEEYGTYVVLFSAGSAIGLIAALGQQTLVVKHFRTAESNDSTFNRALVATNLFWMSIGSGTLILAAGIAWLNRSHFASSYQYVWICCLFAVIFAFSEYFQSYFRIRGTVSLSLTPREIAWRTASVILLFAGGYTGLVSTGFGAMAVVTVALLVVTAYHANYFARERRWIATNSSHVSSAQRFEWNIETLHFASVNLLAACFSYLDTIVVGAMLGVKEAGFYFLAARISALLNLPNAALDTIAIPKIAARLQAADTSGAQRIVGIWSILSFGAAVCGALALIAASSTVLNLFKADSVENHYVLAVLCLQAVSHAYFGPGFPLIMISGGERYFLSAQSKLFAMYFVLLFVLGNLFGLLGIAFASLMLTLTCNLAAAAWIQKKCNIDNMAAGFFQPFLFRRNGRSAPIAVGQRD